MQASVTNKKNACAILALDLNELFLNDFFHRDIAQI